MTRIARPMSKAKLLKIRRLVCKHLDELGATRHSFPVPNTDPRYEPPHYTMDTKAGLLTIHVYGDWIATCFADDKVARRLLPELPKFNGKWNFHFDREADANECARQFALNLDRVLLPAHLPQGAKKYLTQMALAKEYLTITAQQAKQYKTDAAGHAALAICKLKTDKGEDGLSWIDYQYIIKEAMKPF